MICSEEAVLNQNCMSFIQLFNLQSVPDSIKKSFAKQMQQRVIIRDCLSHANPDNERIYALKVDQREQG